MGMSLFDKARVEVPHLNITTVDKKDVYLRLNLMKCLCWLKGQFQAENNHSHWGVPSWLNRLSNTTTNSDMQREGQTICILNDVALMERKKWEWQNVPTNELLNGSIQYQFK